MPDSANDLLRHYLAEVERAHHLGNATEHTYRPMLRDVLNALATAGDRLVALHLMEQRATPITRYPIPGYNLVTKVWYAEPDSAAGTAGRVWINDTQYFEGVPPDVWEAHIGGYQVCEKWLKDRKGRTLTYDDLNHYQAIVSALAETLTLTEGIDETIEDHGGWPIS